MVKTSRYYAISTFDFSMHPGMDFPNILNAVYKNRWSGAFMQSYSRKVIATVGWVEPDTYDVCFAGLRDGAVFIISTLGVNNSECRQLFLMGYREMRHRFPHSQIICVGDRIEGMDDDLCYIAYKESFGNWDRYSDYWQPKILNWDGSLGVNL